MRLSSACIPAVLAAGLVLAGAAQVKAQFAPTPYDPSNAPSVMAPPSNGAGVAPEVTPAESYPAPDAGAYDSSGHAYGESHGGLMDSGEVFDDSCPDGSLGRAIPYCGRGRQYGTGGIANPRWFDLSFEYVELAREEISRRVEFMSRGVAGDPVLTTDDLDFEEEPGFRVTGAYLIQPGTNIEATYLGTFHFQDRFDVVDPNGGLFSAFSDFGTNPGAGMAPAPDPADPTQTILVPVTPGFTDTDNGTFASIIYSSQLNSFELGVRRRWLSPNARIHTSTILGARWINVTERFRHTITTAPGTRTGMDGQAGFPVTEEDGQVVLNPLGGAFAYDVRNSNNLVGFQVGEEIVASITQFFRFGGEVKAGIYGNDMELTTEIQSGLGGERHEFVDNADVAFASEANVYMLLRLSSFATLKGGYTLLYIDGVSLAPEQVDFSNPFITGLRGFGMNDDGNLFYHGFHAGMEVNW